MKICYQSTLEDEVEPQLRLFIRSGAYRKAKWLQTVRLFCIVFICTPLITRVGLNKNIGLWVFVPGLFCATLHFLTFRQTINGRFRKFGARKLKGQLPRTTEYTVENGLIHCEADRVTLTFSLVDLSDVTEDATWLELVFGSRGLCVIPLRAFQSPEEKSLFVAAVRGESDGGIVRSDRTP